MNKKLTIKKTTPLSEQTNPPINMKSNLGQFYTTNYEYILRNMYIPPHIHHIIEPFAGNGDLLSFVKTPEKYKIECYDIDPKHAYIQSKNTLLHPPDYDGAFVLTNPPYLARNKNTDKTLYEQYGCNDLYKCFLVNLIESGCIGGIIIIPLNFLSSILKADILLRKRFLEKYMILILNIFEEPVFDDTTCTVCSFQFERRLEKTVVKTAELTIKEKIPCHLYPSNAFMEMELNDQNNYTIGGEIYLLPKQEIYTIERATRITKEVGNITNILLKAIDDSIETKLQLKMVSEEERFIDNTPKLSARSYATLVIKPAIDGKKQEELVKKFNDFIENHRLKYHSLFLSNYRESNNSIARKRISFDLAFHLCGYLLVHTMP